MRKNKRWKVGIVVMMTLLSVSGCQAVEPEKRAYPLVVGIDWKEESYQVWMDLASLGKDTGQEKQGGEGQNTQILCFTGKNQEEILHAYEISQERYLDIGHVKAVLLGEGLIRQQEQLGKVLDGMEKENILGNSAYVFETSTLEAVMETDGKEVESLGEFLSGMYENRTGEEKREPVRMADLYRERKEQRVVICPQVTAAEGKLKVEWVDET